jgi:hypothetical protein
MLPMASDTGPVSFHRMVAAADADALTERVQTLYVGAFQKFSPQELKRHSPGRKGLNPIAFTP